MILGAGGHAVSVHDVVSSAGWQVLAFAGDAGGQSLPAPVLPGDEAALAMAERERCAMIAAVGDNPLRCRVFARLPAELRAPGLAARTATVAASAVLGTGTVVHHHAHVGPRSTLGEAVIVNTGAIVEHDCVVETGAHVAPGAVLLGGARIGAQTLVGSGARVLPGVRLGRSVIVGAGAVVIRDVPDGLIVTGVPAVGRGGEGA